MMATRREVGPVKKATTRQQAPPRKAGRRWAARTRIFKNVALLYLAVGLGSAIGGTARWLASALLQDGLGAGFPWGTLFVNVTGSFLIGFYATLAGPDGRLFPGPRQRQFMMAGVCGGYTTFSIFSLETLRFLQADRIDLAGLNVSVSLLTWLIAVWIGHALATRINRLKGM